MSNFTKGTWIYIDSLYRYGRLITAAPDMYQWIEKARRTLLDWRITFRDRKYYGDKAMVDDFVEDFLLLIHSSDLLLDRINENGGDPE